MDNSRIGLLNFEQVKNWLIENNMYSQAMASEIDSFPKYIIKGEELQLPYNVSPQRYVANFMVMTCLSATNNRILESEVVTYTVDEKFLVKIYKKK
jgi:hypothetical protein